MSASADSRCAEGWMCISTRVRPCRDLALIGQKGAGHRHDEDDRARDDAAGQMEPEQYRSQSHERLTSPPTGGAGCGTRQSAARPTDAPVSCERAAEWLGCPRTRQVLRSLKLRLSLNFSNTVYPTKLVGQEKRSPFRKSAGVFLAGALIDTVPIRAGRRTFGKQGELRRRNHGRWI